MAKWLTVWAQAQEGAQRQIMVRILCERWWGREEAILKQLEEKEPLPDKLITVLIVFAILKGLPKKLTALYDVNGSVESLD